MGAILGTVIVPPYFYAAVWGIVLVPMLAEVGVELALMRRLGLRDIRFAAFLIVFNLVTWPAFFVTTASIDFGSPVPALIFIAFLEGIVVLVEAYLIRTATEGRHFSVRFCSTPISFRNALVVSAIGTATSLLLGAVFMAVNLLV